MVFSYVAHRHVELGGRVLILVHRSELVDQVVVALRDEGILPGVIAPEYDFQPDAKVQVASVFSLIRRLDKLPPPTLIVCDECFAAGTIVDGRPIESIVVGDMVRSYNHVSEDLRYRPVTAVMSHKPDSLCSVYISGRRYVCTPNHPFYTARDGYIEARELVSGDIIFTLQDVRTSGFYRQPVPAQSPAEAGMGALFDRVLTSVLVKGFFRDDGAYQSSVRFVPDEDTQSDEALGIKGQDVRDAAADKTRSESERREWNWDDVTADALLAGIGRFVFTGVCSADEDTQRQRAPDSLQAGLGAAGIADSNRDRRIFPHVSQKEGTRFQEGQLSHGARVDRVEVHEPTSDGTFGGLLPNGLVYNLEVEENHNYFVDDLLVHNCHHATNKTTWGRIMSHYVQARRLGVTATPWRLSGEGLGDIFDDLILGPTTNELIEQGWLSPVTVYAPSRPDLAGIPRRSGDYALEQLATAMDRPTITGDALDHYKRLAHDKQAVVFCVSVKHALSVSEQFTAAGYPAQTLNGGTERSVRAATVRDFKARSIKILTSCDLISEGFDCPAIECGISLRPTQSLGLWLQQCGRCLRPAPGKQNAVLLDHAGNTYRHGLPTELHGWTLEGTPRSERRVRDQPTVSSVRICLHCFAASPSGTVSCGTCGNSFPIEAREVKEVKGTLEEVKLSPEQRQARIAQGTARSLEALIELGRIRGYRNPRAWAEHVYRGRMRKHG